MNWQKLLRKVLFLVVLVVIKLLEEEFYEGRYRHANRKS